MRLVRNPFSSKTIVFSWDTMFSSLTKVRHFARRLVSKNVSFDASYFFFLLSLHQCAGRVRLPFRLSVCHLFVLSVRLPLCPPVCPSDFSPSRLSFRSVLPSFHLIAFYAINLIGRSWVVSLAIQQFFMSISFAQLSMALKVRPGAHTCRISPRIVIRLCEWCPTEVRLIGVNTARVWQDNWCWHWPVGDPKGK